MVPIKEKDMKLSLLTVALAMFHMLFFPYCRGETIASGSAAEDNQVSRNSAQIQLEGVKFVSGSKTQLILDREGKKYLIDVEKKTISLEDSYTVC
jgi:hypothetical protein